MKSLFQGSGNLAEEDAEEMECIKKIMPSKSTGEMTRELIGNEGMCTGLHGSAEDGVLEMEGQVDVCLHPQPRSYLHLRTTCK